MAVYTDVTDEELDDFLQDFDIGQATSFKGIAEGVENSNYLLNTNRGSFILTLYEKRVNPDDLPFFIGLMEHLSANGFSCPTPIKRNDGKTLSELAGRPAAIISFLEGMSVRRPKTQHCAELGKALAELHNVAANFHQKRPNSLSLSSWAPLFAMSRDRIDTVLPGVAEEIDAELLFLSQNWPSTLPTGVIHADLFPDNVFFINDRVSGLIDFYFACTDALAYDLAICLNAWCFEPDHQFNVTKARALLKGYQSIRTLTPQEYRALPLLARGSALRFFLTRLYDYLDVPEGALVTPKDPSEYLAKLRFHRSVQSPADYGVEEVPQAETIEETVS